MMRLLFISFYQLPGLALVGLLVIITCAALLKNMGSKKRPADRRNKNKIESEAIVLSIDRKGLDANNQLQVRLQMQVQPEKGRNFIIEIDEIISSEEFETIYAGRKVKVLYNPSNIKEVSLFKAA